MKQELETLLIPLIFLIAMIVISYVMYREDKPIQEPIQEVELSEEDMFIIEEQMKRDMLFCAKWWKIQGNFNTAQYVKYLEYKASKG